MSPLGGPFLFVATILAMEGVAYVAHRWVMHGPGWFLHESHHRERPGLFELNDLYAVIFAAPSIVLLLGGVQLGWGDWATWGGAGIAAYGAIYFGFHDVIVHRRVKHRYVPRSTYMKRIVQAHRLHHATQSKHGSVSFGFLWAPRPEVLKRQLGISRSATSARREAEVPVGALLFAVLVMSAIVGGRYLAFSGGFAWLTARRFPRLYSGRSTQIRREIGWSLLSTVIYGAPAGILMWGWQQRGWTRIYSNPADYPLWWLPLSVLVYLVLHDSWFYWTHRLMHRPALFKVAHAVHHASRKPTAWTAMSFHPWESVVGAVLVPALVLLIPIHYAALLVVLTVMTVMGVTNHMGWEMFPRGMVEGPAGRWLITASHHQRHHEKYLCNFGLYFRFWDWLCGTDRGLGRFG